MHPSAAHPVIVLLRERTDAGQVRDHEIGDGFTVEGDPAEGFRIRFHAPNFSPRMGRLIPAADIRPDHGPLLHPAALPVWSSGPLPVPAPESGPIRLSVPLRRILNIGHRGSPYHYPENTIASFRRALDEGANGLELDICITRDGRLLVFHDPRPDPVRLLFEDFPYELVSPVIERRFARILHPRGDTYVQTRRVVRWSKRTFDIVRLTLAQAREYYRYRLAGGVDHPLPDLPEVLAFAADERERLRMLFLDIKNPDWRGPRARKQFLRYGELLARALRDAPLPPVVVVANEREDVLEAVREAFRREGEERCLFSLDAAGGFLALLGVSDDPVATAQRLGTRVVSVGARFRAGDEGEIAAATRARDSGAGVSLVLHWTINDEETMRSSLAAGVDGILTDSPALLREVLAAQGITTGAAYHTAARSPAIT